MNDYGKTSEKLEGQKVEGAEAAANEADKFQPNNWTTGKPAPRSEDAIKTEAAEEKNGDTEREKQLMQNRAEQREIVNSHDGLPDVLDAETIRAEPPLEFTGLSVSEIEHTAAGLPAVWSTMKHGLGKMGVKRTVQTFLKVNQKGGFDCQSCAWADPDDHRHLAEFCENGAKAIADEAMTRTVTPDFFKEYQRRRIIEAV